MDPKWRHCFFWLGESNRCGSSKNASIMQRKSPDRVADIYWYSIFCKDCRFHELLGCLSRNNGFENRMPSKSLKSTGKTSVFPMKTIWFHMVPTPMLSLGSAKDKVFISDVPAEIGDQWEIHGGLPNPHGRGWQLPSGNDCYSSRTGSHGPVEIVDLPIENAWWIFPVRYVRGYLESFRRCSGYLGMGLAH